MLKYLVLLVMVKVLIDVEIVGVLEILNAQLVKVRDITHVKVVMGMVHILVDIVAVTDKEKQVI